MRPIDLESPDRLAIRVLGTLQISVNAKAQVRSGVSRRLLAALAISDGRRLSGAALASALWDGTPISRSALQVAVHRCRRALAHEGSNSIGLDTTATGYELVLGGRLTDVDLFTQLLSEGPTNLTSLCTALAIWRGPVLADEPRLAEYFGDRVRLLEQARRQGALSLARTALATNQPARALPAVRALSRADPLDEELAAAYLDLLGATGRGAQAVTEFRRVSTALDRELQVSPGTGLQLAFRRATSQPHRASRPAGPCLLPAPLADFTGRRDQLAVLATQVRSGHRPTVISGPPGVGKTTLAVRAAQLATARFPGGVLYCDLHGSSDPMPATEALARFLRALGLAPSRLPAALDERSTLLRAMTATTPVLLIADDAANAAQVRPLLPGINGCLLITSRRPLVGLECVKRTVLLPFSLSEAVALLRAIVGTGRTADQQHALQEVAQYCDRLPLAVRIAALRLSVRPHWSIPRMASLLADEHTRLDQLHAGDLNVRAAIELSYRQLADPEQRALRLLARLGRTEFPARVCAAALDAAESTGEEVVDALAQLHLLDVVAAAPAAETRYRLPTLIRIFALERSRQLDPAADPRAAADTVAGGRLTAAGTG